MKKRLFKKLVKKMSDSELNEHVAYCENKCKQQILFKEFDKRFNFEQENENLYNEFGLRGEWSYDPNIFDNVITK